MTRFAPPAGLGLPRAWPKRVRSAMIHAISLAHAAIITAYGRAARHPNARVRLRAENDRLRREVGLLEEELRIKDARLMRVSASHRPHYAPASRLAILELRAARGWSLRQTARRMLVTTATVGSWMRRLDEQGRKALVQTREPVNRFPDFVHHIVRGLRLSCPTLGKKKIAQVLCRAGLHLSASSVRRFLRVRNPKPPREGRTVPAAKPISSSRPNHIWLVDLTAVPTTTGLWTSWLPTGVPRCWPFCWWVAVIVDHYSRRIMGLEAFASHPTSLAVRKSIARAIHNANAQPRYLMTDRGGQFRDAGFRRWCRRRGIRQRLGTARRHGGTAVVERLIRTIKEECTRRLFVPFVRQALSRELLLYSRWYNELRPHQGIRAATPDEVYRGVAPPSMRSRFEPRLHWPRDSPCAAPHVPVRGRCGARLALHIRYLAGRRHLPIVSLRPAA